MSSAFVEGWSLSRRQLSPVPKSTTMIPFAPFRAESVMNATPSVPRRKSKRTSFK